MIGKSSVPFIRVLFVVILVLIIAMSSVFSTQSVKAQGGTPPPPPPGPRDPVAAALLAQQGATVSYRTQTGLANFIGAAPAQPIRLASALPAGAPRSQAAKAFLDQYGKLFGLNSSQELSVSKETSPDSKRAIVRFQQVYQGVPVFGGELVVQVNAANEILSANGEVSPDLKLSTTPQVAASTAVQSAVDAVAKSYKLPPAALKAANPQLWIYDPALVGPSSSRARLVWRMDVVAVALQPIRELVLVDAQRGGVALHFNQIDTIGRSTGKATTAHKAGGNGQAASAPVLGTPLISVYTMNGSTNEALLPGTLICTQANPTACNSDADAQAAYANALATYNFYATNFSRDSINGAGMQIVSSVHFGVGYQNAFWNGSQMVYGDGFSLADDVVAHELTHGVTEYEGGLFYFYQSGAINESLSDTFGEYTDLTDGIGTDTAGVRWQLGEDLPPSIGVIRNMKDPTIYGDPDKMTSVYYYTGLGDNGGVHFNSGVNNKVAYLLADGDTFNGKTVTALGITKAAKIYYEFQTNLMTSGTDYFDMYNELYQACVNLIGTSGITAGDCTQVRNATDAVEMNLQPVAGYNPDAEVCPAGQNPSNLFYDTMESGFANWTFGVVSGTQQWTTSDPYGPNDHSGTHVLYADDYFTSSSSYAAMVGGVTLPANAYLHFYHYFDLESGYDGGRVEYSANGGAWTDGGSLINSGKAYNGTASSLGGSAFTASSHGYVSTRLNLSSLAGSSVKFRFRMGTDISNYVWGWWVDDVRIYTCAAPVTGEGIGGYNPTNSVYYLRNTLNGGPANFQFQFGPAGAGWKPLAGDWNNDGVDTIGGYNPTNGVFYLRNSNAGGNADYQFQFGPPSSGWLPLAGDWNGDGTDTIGGYNPTNSVFYLRDTNNGGPANYQFQFGPAGAGWLPLAGDWDGNGTDTIGLYNPTNGVYYLRNTNNGGNADYQFQFGPGGAGWLPLAGDWDGNGSASIGGYNPSNGVYYLRNTNNGGPANYQFQFGPAGAGWLPIAGRWSGVAAAPVAPVAPEAPAAPVAPTFVPSKK